MMVFVSYLPRILIIALHLDNSIIVDSARVTLHVVRVEQPQVVVLLLVCHQVDKLSPLQWSGTGKVNPPRHSHHYWAICPLFIHYIHSYKDI